MVCCFDILLQQNEAYRAMITTAFISVLIGLLFVLISPVLLLPNVTIDSSFSVAIATASGYLASANAILPVISLLAIVTFFVLFETGYAIYKAVKWVYSKLPGIN